MVKEFLLSLFQPFRVISKKAVFGLFMAQAILAIVIWGLTCSALIPGPVKVFDAVLRIISTKDFADNLFSSLLLTVQGMFYSIIIALVIGYLYLIPFFKPLGMFVVKCRYLTLTGLIFVFTLLSRDGHSLKINLLIFGIVPFFLTSIISILDGIDEQEFELCKTLKMSNWRALYEIVILGRIDQVFKVMQQNFAIAWMMITMVEGLNMSEGGLGTMLIKSNKYIDLASVFGVLVIILSVGIIWDYFLGMLRLWLCPYTKIQILQ